MKALSLRGPFRSWYTGTGAGRWKGQVPLSWNASAGFLAFSWLLVAAYLAVTNAWDTFSTGSLIAVDPGRAGLHFNLAVLGITTALSTLIGLLTPAWWRRALLALALLPFPILAVTSHNLPAALTTLALLLPFAWLSRYLVATRLEQHDPVVAWTLGSGLALGLLAFLGFTLGMLGLLRPALLWPLLLLLWLLLVRTAHRPLRADLAALRVWLRCPVARRPAHFLLTGMALAFLWLNLIGAFTPEGAGDAVVMRLPTAVYFAQTGRLTTDMDLGPSFWPAAGEVIYAVALTLGPLQSAKLLNFAVGLFAAAALFVLGRRLAAAQAGSLAAFTFYTMPLVAWLSQTAYLDLFTTFFALTAALAILLPSRLDWRGTSLAATLIALGVAVKVHFGYVAVGLAVMLGLRVLGESGWRTALRLTLLLVLVALLAAAPWLLRSYVVMGAVPGWAHATRSLSGATVGDYYLFGFGRSVADLARLPLDLTLRNGQFGSHTQGGLGYLLLALLPLLLLTRPHRLTLATLAGTLVALLFWFYTVQYQRYGLPLFALLCAVAATAFVAVQARSPHPLLRTALALLLVGVASAGVSVQLKEPLVGRQVVLGREDATTFLQNAPGYPALQLLNAEPQATRAFAPGEYARLYAHVRLSTPATTGRALMIEGDEKTVLARLDEGGYSHIVVDRKHLPRNWDRITVLNEEFLRRNTVLVGGSMNTYLYRILPPGQRGGQLPWARGAELLSNGGFEAAAGDLPAGWSSANWPVFDLSGTESYHGRGAVRCTPADMLITAVPVVPNVQYLLSHATRSAQGNGLALLHITWQDADGNVVGRSGEIVPASPQKYHVHSMLATAPANAEIARIFLLAFSGEVWFDDVSFRSVPPIPNTAAGEKLPSNLGFEDMFKSNLSVSDTGGGAAPGPESSTRR